MFFSGEKRYAETRSGAHFKAQAMGFHMHEKKSNMDNFKRFPSRLKMAIFTLKNHIFCSYLT